MQEQLAHRLRGLNRRFYARFAADFDATRQRPWPGWQRVVRQLPQATGEVPSVLDVGCGNGRFAGTLASCWQQPFRYVGVDDCAALLELASARLGAACGTIDLHRADILADDLEDVLAGERFDLVALFGVLHHLPGSAARYDLLSRLGTLLAPGGTLALSIWRLDRTPQFARRLVSWQTIDTRRPEAGDVLLSWAGDTEHPRYCHFPGDREIESWLGAPGVPLIDRFESDGPSGRDNLYLVFRR